MALPCITWIFGVESGYICDNFGLPMVTDRTVAKWHAFAICIFMKDNSLLFPSVIK